MTTAIVHAGHPVLRAKAAAVPARALGSPALHELVAEMIAAMRAAPGVGLAAPQIGVDAQVLVLEDTEEHQALLSPEERAERGRVPVPLTAIVNPVLQLLGEPGEIFYEGCLSVPGYAALVPRAREVQVDGLTPEGAPFSWRVSGWPARILQHEVDHLAGTLYVDRMLSRSLATGDLAQRFLARPQPEIAQALRVELWPK